MNQAAKLGARGLPGGTGGWPRVWFALLAGLALWAALSCTAQSTSSSTVSARITPTQPPDSNEPLSGPMGDPIYRERRLRQITEAQHKSMVADTGELLRLVTELNAEIAGANPDSLTPDQLRKVARIEKLARSVKDKMRMPIGGMPDLVNTFPNNTLFRF